MGLIFLGETFRISCLKLRNFILISSALKMPPEVQFCSLLCKQNWRSYQPIVQGLPTVLSAIQFSTNLPRVYGIRQFTSNARPYTEYTIYCVMDIYASSHSELI